MNIQKLECPNCHAGLDSDYGNEGIFFCKYCGQKIIVEEIQNAEYDLKIRKMELEHEANKIAMEQKSQNMKYIQENQKKSMDHDYTIKVYILYICASMLILGFFALLYILVTVLG